MTTSKSDSTKQRILAAATKLFAEHSFDRASVRAISREAKVDPALINHYFGSKEGLFEAVVESALPLQLIDTELSAADAQGRGAALLERADMLWSSPAGRGIIAIARRAIVGDVSALQRPVSRALIAHLKSHIEGSDEERTTRATLVVSQMVGVIMARHIVKLEPLASMSRDDLVAAVGPTIQRYLTDELPLDFEPQAE